ncbi:hypothetical protein EC930055_5345, partial [Escherichia coli 93.0055]
VSIQNGPP